MTTTIRMKCVSTHKVNASGVTFFDARLLAASASEQPAGVFADKPAGKFDLQRLAAQPFEQDQEYIITIEQVPAPAPVADDAASAKTSAPAPAPTTRPANEATAVPPAPKTPGDPAAASKPVAQTK
jgi:hypothetical protein